MTPTRRPWSGRHLLHAARFEWWLSWRLQRARGVVAVAALPVAGAVIVSGLKQPGWVGALGVDILPIFLAAGFVPVLLVVVPLWLGTQLIAREEEARTLTYLLIRPLAREALLAGKFLGAWGVASALLWGSWIASAAVLLLADRFVEAERVLQTLPGVLVALAIGALAYGALFTLVGLIGRRPALVGLFLAFGWENVIPFLPGRLRNLTVRHHLVGLLPDGALPDGVRLTLSAPGFAPAMAWLLAGSLLCLVLSAILFRRRDYP